MEKRHCDVEEGRVLRYLRGPCLFSFGKGSTLPSNWHCKLNTPYDNELFSVFSVCVRACVLCVSLFLSFSLCFLFSSLSLSFSAPFLSRFCFFFHDDHEHDEQTPRRNVFPIIRSGESSLGSPPEIFPNKFPFVPFDSLPASLRSSASSSSSSSSLFSSRHHLFFRHLCSSPQRQGPAPCRATQTCSG